MSAEVRWRAHPERRGWLARVHRRLLGTRGGETLRSALDDVLVDGRKPATEQEWGVVESVLLLRSAASDLRGAWGRLEELCSPPTPPVGRGEPVALAEWVRGLYLEPLLACEDCAAVGGGLAETVSGVSRGGRAWIGFGGV